MYGELSNRKKEILRAVVEAHIRLGEPVGSRALTDGSGGQTFSLSSATIRNEMAELEQMGYLTQPHTSAGRIPSELGYRFYVDALMQRYEMTQREIDQIRETLQVKNAELDAILKNAGKVASHLTGYTSIALKPKAGRQSVMRFSVTPIDEHSFLLVMVLSRSTAKTRFIQTSATLPPEALILLEQVLNDCAAGRDVSAMTLPEMVAMETRMGPFAPLISPVMKYVYDTLSEGSGSDLQLSGMEHLLHYQEFSDLDRLREVFGVFDRGSDKLMDLVTRADPAAVSVLIGRENDLDAMQSSSLVFKKIMVGDKTVGAIGVIGPCRMDYSKVISTIQYLSDDVAGMISGRGTPTIHEGGSKND